MASFATTYPSPLERQFARFYNREKQQYAHLHKNNSVCMIGLAPSHPAVLAGVVNVEFAKAVSTSEAQGKRKRGALGLRTDTIVCTVTDKEGNVHRIDACVNVDLVEINQRLADEPELVSIDPEAAGFLCICLTRTESNMEKCFPGFTKEGDILRFSPDAKDDSVDN